MTSTVLQDKWFWTEVRDSNANDLQVYIVRYYYIPVKKIVPDLFKLWAIQHIRIIDSNIYHCDFIQKA